MRYSAVNDTPPASQLPCRAGTAAISAWNDSQEDLAGQIVATTAHNLTSRFGMSFAGTISFILRTVGSNGLNVRYARSLEQAHMAADYWRVELVVRR